jgi:hypothetical protein
MVTDPLRIRDTAPSSDKDDGASDSVSTKLIGIGLTLLGAALVAPQCELESTCSWVKLICD